MMMRASALLVALSASAATAQQPHSHGETDADALSPAARQFLEDARVGTTRYRDRRNAIADGYRRLGPAFPGMGEHWVHPGLIVRGRVEARSPSVLCYADSAGVITLVGLAYTIPVGPGDTLPTHVVGSDGWHQHADDVDAETLLLVHPTAHAGDPDRPRLAMFHAWPWLANPGGSFAQNNWTLPFIQLGLPAPERASPDAAQALSLITVGPPYYELLLDALVAPTPRERAALRRALEHATARVEAWRTAAPPRAATELEIIWRDLWVDLDGAVGSAARKRLRSYAGRPSTHVR